MRCRSIGMLGRRKREKEGILEGQLAVPSFGFPLSFLNLIRKLLNWEDEICYIEEERCSTASEVSVGG